MFLFAFVLALHALLASAAIDAESRESGAKLRRATAGQDQRFKEAVAVVGQGITDRAFPGAVLAIGYRGELVALKSFGYFDYSPHSKRVPINAIWDMASCTKVVGTTTAVAILVEEGKIDLDSPVVKYIPDFGSTTQPSGAAAGAIPIEARGLVTIRHLMTHSSGLPSGAPLYSGLEDRGKKLEILRRADRVALIHLPGAEMVYSDLSMMLMQQIVESITHLTLDRFLQQRVFGPLGMRRSLFNPPRSLQALIPPAEDDHRLRKRIIHGEVHDQNSWMMGGVAGHAGLFSTAGDLAVFEQMLLNGGIYGRKRILKQNTVEEFTRQQHITAGSSRALGWDTPWDGSSAGHYLSPRAFGHTGFTGTSMWADPEKQLFIILLTNRVHPLRTNMKIDQVRPAVADAVVKALNLE